MPLTTATTLTDNGPNPSASGRAVSFTVTVSPAVTNGESVSLEDASNGNAVVGTGTLSGGTATISVSSLSVGAHNIFALYGGDADDAGSQSSQVTQTVDALPAVTNQPTDQTVASGGNVSFTAAASGTPAPTVQWYFNMNDGNGFTAVANGGVYSGATTNTLTITGATADMIGNQYEAVFTNPVGIASTNAANLTVTNTTAQRSV